MDEIEILEHARGHVRLRMAGRIYQVDGEGLRNGPWVIFPLMVYAAAGPDLRRVEDAVERERIVAALCARWDAQGVAYEVETG
jgi:hypothetical protein